MEMSHEQELKIGSYRILHFIGNPWYVHLSIAAQTSVRVCSCILRASGHGRPQADLPINQIGGHRTWKSVTKLSYSFVRYSACDDNQSLIGRPKLQPGNHTQVVVDNQPPTSYKTWRLWPNAILAYSECEHNKRMSVKLPYIFEIQFSREHIALSRRTGPLL